MADALPRPGPKNPKLIEFGARAVEGSISFNYGTEVTLLDLFAAAALTGMLATDAERGYWAADDLARQAYLDAAAMLRARDAALAETETGG